MVESELLLLYQTRNVDVHFEVDGVVTYESSVEQLVQLHELGKPCRHQTQTGHPICSYGMLPFDNHFTRFVTKLAANGAMSCQCAGDRYNAVSCTCVQTSDLLPGFLVTYHWYRPSDEELAVHCKTRLQLFVRLSITVSKPLNISVQNVECRVGYYSAPTHTKHASHIVRSITIHTVSYYAGLLQNVNRK